MPNLDLFGWELTYLNSFNSICTEEDALLLLLHWKLIKHGFRCIGLGKERTFDKSVNGSEAMPDGWNTMENSSGLRYLIDNELFVLYRVRTGEHIVFNLLRASDNAVVCSSFKARDIVLVLHGTLEEMIPTYKDVIHKLWVDLIEPIETKQAVKAMSTQTVPTSSRTRSTTEWSPYQQPPRHSVPAQGSWIPDVRDIGRSDLDPLAGFGPNLGGGMIFNPFQNQGGIRDPGAGIPGGLPRGAVPPGARFDPFGPPGPNRGLGPRSGEPDPDHLPPPGYDDMFM